MQPIVQFDGWQIVDLQTRLHHFQPETKILSDAILGIAAQSNHFTTAQHYAGVIEKKDFRGDPLVVEVVFRDLLRVVGWLKDGLISLPVNRLDLSASTVTSE
jgi:hypothetical protein